MLISDEANIQTPSHAPRRKIKKIHPARLRAYQRRAKKKKVKLEIIMLFAQQLASMLKAGLPLIETLKALEEQSEDPVFQVIVREIRDEVANGKKFSDATRQYPNAFPNLFISLAEAGEASGGLAEMMEKTAQYLHASVSLAKKVKSALVYPAVVIFMAIALVAVLLVFVIPVFSDMFADFGAKLPAPTLMLIGLSDFLQHNILYLIVACVVIYYAIKAYIKTPRGRVLKDRLIWKAPLFGPLIQKVSVARFARTYAILLKSGVSLLRCIQICSNASGNTYIEGACLDIARAVNQGGQLSESIEYNAYFPMIMIHMVRAGEKTGNVDEMLNNVAGFFEEEIDNVVAALTSLLEPLLIAFLGIVVGSIVMAMFLPIFQLSSVVGG